MTQRMTIFKTAPEGIKAMMAVEGSIEKSGLDRGLIELVRLRASQINGCAFCIYTHVETATKLGESAMRLHMLDAWRESSLYTARERAALNWVERLTRVSDHGAPDEDYDLLAAHFNESEIAYLTLAIGTINLWNRVQIGLRATHPAGEHKAA